MNKASQTSEFLVLSRGQWDKDASKQAIEAAIHQFYDWLARNIDEGKMKTGSRLQRGRALVSKKGIVTDGPLSESKEIAIGSSSPATSRKLPAWRPRTLVRNTG